MTPSELIADARSQYNAVNDTTFFTEPEMLRWVYHASLELSRKAYALERVYSSSTVIGQREYDYPSQTLAIKRITYNGQKLFPVTMKEDDVLTLSNSDTVETGTPNNYYIWNETVCLRPVPAEVAALVIYAYAEPQPIAISSELEIPTQYHADLINYVCHRMAMKDRNIPMSREYFSYWAEAIKQAKVDMMKKKRGDAFHVVKDHESLPYSVLGGG